MAANFENNKNETDKKNQSTNEDSVENKTKINQEDLKNEPLALDKKDNQNKNENTEDVEENEEDENDEFTDDDIDSDDDYDDIEDQEEDQEEPEEEKPKEKSNVITCPKCLKEQTHFILPSSNPKTPTVICPSCNGQVGKTKIPKKFHKLKVKKQNLKKQHMSNESSQTDSKPLTRKSNKYSRENIPEELETEDVSLFDDGILEPHQILEKVLKDAPLVDQAVQYLVNKGKRRYIRPDELANVLSKMTKEVWKLRGIPSEDIIDDIVHDYAESLKVQESKSQETGNKKYYGDVQDYSSRRSNRNFPSRDDYSSRDDYRNQSPGFGQGTGMERLKTMSGNENLTAADVAKILEEEDRKRREKELWDERERKFQDILDKKEQESQAIKEEFESRLDDIMEKLEEDKKPKEDEVGIKDVMAKMEQQAKDFEHKIQLQQKEREVEESNKRFEMLMKEIKELKDKPQYHPGEKYSDDFYRFVSDSLHEASDTFKQKNIAKDVGMLLVAYADPDNRKRIHKALPQILAGSGGGGQGGMKTPEEKPKDLKEAEDAKVSPDSIENMPEEYVE